MKVISPDRVKKTGVIVIGSGLAGMVTALKLNPVPVLLLTKSRLGEGSSSRLAQGGMAAAIGDDDSPDLHIADTESVGKGLSNDRIVRIITESASEEVDWLTEIGVEFDRDPKGGFSLGKEGAHSRRRILHAHGDKTGAELIKSLRNAVLASDHIEIMENVFAADLIRKDDRIVGVLLRSEVDGEWYRLYSRETVVATGGIGALFGQTTNPVESTGDGLAMAFRAGVRMADMEFVQFHPTALLSDRRPLPLLTEALRGEGATLIDGDGKRFMRELHSLGELAPRDVVSRAIWNLRRKNIPVFLDCRPIWSDDFPRRFPTVMSNCREAGLDPSRDPIPVVTAAHYHIGGILTDPEGQSSVPGLRACGESAATMIHGANRLASNSLLEALIVGARVAGDIKAGFSEEIISSRIADEDWAVAEAPCPAVRDRITRTMWTKVGLLRCRLSLGEALEELEELDSSMGDALCEEKNMITVGKLIARSALIREESRGVHYRTDFPETNPAWNRHICLQGDKMFTIKSVEGTQEVLAQ